MNNNDALIKAIEFCNSKIITYGNNALSYNQALEEVKTYLLSLQSQPQDKEVDELRKANEELKEDNIMVHKLLWECQDAKENQSPPINKVEEKGYTDLQNQVREHIKQYDLYEWDEALTNEEMTYLENLLLTFMPIVPPGSIGYEKLMKAFPAPPVNVDDEEKLMQIALEKYSSPHGSPNPQTYAYIEGLKSVKVNIEEASDVINIGQSQEKDKEIADLKDRIKKQSQMICGQVMEIDSLLELNRKIGEERDIEIKELKKEIYLLKDEIEILSKDFSMDDEEKEGKKE